MSRPSKVADWEVAIALYRGESRADLARRLGVSYQAIFYAAKRWTDAGGDPFPDARRRPLSSREKDIVALYRSGKSLREIGATNGLSHERVRQIIQSYERKTGSAVARHPKGKPGRGAARVPRVTWRCHGCGLERALTPGQLRCAPGMCIKCMGRSRRKSPAPDVIEEWIAQRRTGITFGRIAANAGYTTRNAHYVLRYVAIYLRDQGRLHELNGLQRRGRVPRWLAKVVPGVAEMAAQGAAP